PRTYGLEKDTVMIDMIAVAIGRIVAVLTTRTERIRRGRHLGIFFVVFLEKFGLDVLRECVDRVTWLGFARLLADGDAIADGQDALRADEANAVIFTRAIDEIHAQREVERWHFLGGRIVVETEQDVGNVSIFPETGSTRRVDARGTNRASDEMHPGEQVHEQIAGHARSVFLVIAPAE